LTPTFVTVTFIEDACRVVVTLRDILSKDNTPVQKEGLQPNTVVLAYWQELGEYLPAVFRRAMVGFFSFFFFFFFLFFFSSTSICSFSHS